MGRCPCQLRQSGSCDFQACLRGTLFYLLGTKKVVNVWNGHCEMGQNVLKIVSVKVNS